MESTFIIELQPTLHLDIDRTRAQSVGLAQNDVAQSLLLTLSSRFQTNPSFWANPQNGVNYSVAVQVPQYKIDSMHMMLRKTVAYPCSCIHRESSSHRL